MLEVEGIDHVALAVRDVERSVLWYREVLGLERRHADVWGDVPAFICAGTTCLALFPVNTESPKPPPDRRTLTMRHLAFRVNRENFVHAQRALAERGISFTSEDHTIALSIYFADPDGHQLEITTYDVAEFRHRGLTTD
jgi:catechol 2,3-dioxygenase-like lactoylglutathione lyase family enzyme